MLDGVSGVIQAHTKKQRDKLQVREQLLILIARDSSENPVFDGQTLLLGHRVISFAPFVSEPKQPT